MELPDDLQPVYSNVARISHMQLARGFRVALVLAAVLAVVAVITGTFASVALNLPTGATIVLLNFAMFALIYAGKRLVTRD